MRIISNFHDYYDSVQRTGMDKNVVYVRETSEILIKDDFEVDTRSSSNWHIELLYLGYCGQIYKVYIVKGKDQPDRIYYDFEAFKEESLSLGATGKFDFGRKWWNSRFDKFRDEDTQSLNKFFHDYQVPIFLIRESTERNKQRIVLNPSLKDFKFQTIKDTYTAYQDIFQYVSGVLNSRENDTVEISDRDKIHKHGFDKWSFRKMPKKK